ncbi:replication-relaxation family protein [Bdellovibrio sp. HCB-162]|uniref:replication-relaxation family protein n=1 Tax=Bdellovibrio sp. HCB-162 TaxID=3394234 RepID=UPI0039BCF47F
MSEAQSKSTLKEEVKVPMKELNTLEKNIIKYILEMRYMNLGQIKKKFFRANEEFAAKASGVVADLVTSGYLKTKDPVLTLNSLFTVTNEGREVVVNGHPGKTVPQVQKNIFSPRVKHDLLLNDLRIRFEDLNFLTKWISEVSLKEIGLFLREFKDLPDAVCYKKDKKAYFLELEVSPKSPKVYAERIDHYLKVLENEEIQKAGIEGVIFFCTDDKVIEKIKAQIPEGVKEISVLSYHKYFAPKPPEQNKTAHEAVL